VRQLGLIDVARDLYTAVIAQGSECDAQDVVARGLHGVAIIALTRGNYPAARDSYEQALANADAALRVFTVALESTSVSRVRLHGLSGALQTAIVLHRVDEISQYRREIAQLMPAIAEPYTLATIGLEFADALYQLGERASADETLAKARALAVEQSYHELVHRAEQTAALWRAPVHAGTPGGRDVPQQPRPRRSEHFRTVLRSLNGLTAASR
jgi:tetratricopeptide (TPR) repeat protein